jgi:hypothetical protein
MGLLPQGRAAVCFKPVQSGPFDELLRDLDQLLEVSGKTTGTAVTQTTDDYGFRWVVLEDDAFDDLVTTAHLVNQTIEERGFSEQLLCSVFGFRPGSPAELDAAADAAPGEEAALPPGPPDAAGSVTQGSGTISFVYLYKRGTFYPFAPRGEPKRDNALELRMQAALASELPMEPELERWFPVWGAPI